MSKLAQSIRTHAEKLEKGQYAWIKTSNGYCHGSREHALEKAREMKKYADRLQTRYLINLYR